MTLKHEQIYQQVKQIPRGCVATYGQIAGLAGYPRHARQAGYALAALRDKPELQVPWHRVVNAKGEISMRSSGSGCDELQRIMLEDEGIVFDGSGRINLSEFQWRPKQPG